jgi:hypothetical protein
LGKIEQFLRELYTTSTTVELWLHRDDVRSFYRFHLMLLSVIDSRSWLIVSKITDKVLHFLRNDWSILRYI